MASTQMSRRRFLAATTATAAAVGAPGALAGVAAAHGGRNSHGHGRRSDPARADQHPAVHAARPAGDRLRGHARGAARHRLPARRARGLRRPHRHAVQGGAGRRGIRATSGHVRHPAAVRRRGVERLTRGCAPSGPLHRAPVLRDQLRDGRGRARLRHVGGLRARPQPRRADGERAGLASATTTTTGSSSGSPTTRRGPRSMSSSRRPTRATCTSSWTCSGPGAARATRSTSWSGSTGGSASTT